MLNMLASVDRHLDKIKKLCGTLLVQVQNQTSDLTAVLVRGIPGSGKSLLCQTLVNLLGGQHLNQDEVEAKYAGQRNVTPFQIFLQLVESTASRPSVRYLFVDSKLPGKSSREGISAAVACGFAQRNIRSLNGVDAEEGPKLNVVLLSLKARAEAGDELQLCAARILQRSLKHVALIPHAAQERVILDAICKDEEPIRPEEADTFDVCKTVDMSLPASLVVSSALEVLPCISIYLPEQISSAIQAAQKVERDLSLRWTTLFWKVEILQQHVSVLFSDLAPRLNEMCNAIEAQHTVKAQQLEDLHVTVLWTGFHADSEQKLLEFEGQEVGIAVTSLCCDVELGLVAVRVSLDHIQSLCENPDPHITVAKLPGVAAKQSNGVLLRHRTGDTSVLHYELSAPLRVRGVVQRQLSVESMAAGTAALASTLPQGNPFCELGLAASQKSFDILATEGPSFASDFMRGSQATCRVSQLLQHCRWPPKLPGKVWLTIHEFPVTEQSRLMLELMENNQIFSSLEVAVCYIYVAENLLQKTYPKLLIDLEQRCSGRCLEALQHAYRCLNHWRPQADCGKSPSRLALHKSHGTITMTG